MTDAASSQAAPPRLGLARNSLFNLLGQGLPFLAALFAIPLLVGALGTDRFGVLTLAWVVIGYFNLFDLGLSGALTQVVSERLGTSRDGRAPGVAWTGLALLLALGLVGGLVAVLAAPWLVLSVLNVPAPLQAEAVTAFRWLGAAIPSVLLTAGLGGILTAFRRFALLNAIRAPLGIYVLVAPLAVLPFSRSLVTVMLVLVVGRFVAFLAHLVACLPLLPPPRDALGEPWSGVRPLFRLGAWMTVSSIISPLLVYLDRFVIGAALSVAFVAYYTTPYEVITRLLIVPAAILTVLFPAFAATHLTDRDALLALFRRGTSYVALLMFPVLLLVVAFAPEGLTLWLGAEFARHGTPVLQWLAVGVFVNAIARVFTTLLQGAGRPDLTARLHLVELPLYVPLLWLAIGRWGIAGAAMAWTARVTLDAVLLFAVSLRFFGDRAAVVRRLAPGLLAATAALALPALVTPLAARAALAATLLAAFSWLGWSLVLGPFERTWIRGLVARPGRA